MNTDETTSEITDAPQRSGARATTFVVAVTLVLVAFLGAYAYASSRPAGDGVACEDGVVAGDASAEDCGDGCCGTGEAAPLTSGEAVLESGIQRISVDVSNGYFDPSEVVVQAGVPIEITFGEGQGCMAEVMFEQFGVLKDLTSGGAVVELPALEPGTYEFSCGMRMVFGTLVVR